MGASHYDVHLADEVGMVAAARHRNRPSAADFAEIMAQAEATKMRDPVLTLRGLGKELWADEDADAYVRRQRQGWQ